MKVFRFLTELLSFNVNTQESGKSYFYSHFNVWILSSESRTPLDFSGNWTSNNNSSREDLIVLNPQKHKFK